MTVKPKIAETIDSEQTQQDGRFNVQSQDEGPEEEPELKPDHEEECTNPELEFAGLAESEEREPEPARVNPEPAVEEESVEPETGPASLEPEPETVEPEPESTCAEPEPESTCAEPAPESIEQETGPASLEPEPELEPIPEVTESEPEATEPKAQAAEPETERNTESPIEVIDPVSARNSVPLTGKRTIIIEDEQTGSVTVSYGDELVRVELNESSGDEFSDVEETEEQRILRESGAQIIEDDEDDCEEELQTIDIQLENTARKSVIRSPADKNSEASEKQNTDDLLLQDKMQQSDKQVKRNTLQRQTRPHRREKNQSWNKVFEKSATLEKEKITLNPCNWKRLARSPVLLTEEVKLICLQQQEIMRIIRKHPTHNSSLPGNLTPATLEYGKWSKVRVNLFHLCVMFSAVYRKRNVSITNS